MPNIRSILEEIWTNKVPLDYNTGTINSEGALQACIYHHLRSASELNNHDIWVVSTLYFDDICAISNSRPDFLISLNSEIVCMIELKYNIEIGVDPYPDLNKLNIFSTQAGVNKLILKTDPSTGTCRKDLHFSISENVLSVYAVIAHKLSNALYKERWNEIKLPKNFLHLIGKIDGISPSFFHE